MKTKIFVCSNSAIDYVTHDSNIEAIPVILSFSNEEKYEDYLDISTEAFYNRICVDKKAKAKPIFQNYSKISEHIDEAKKKGYEQVLFILSSKEFANLYVSTMIAVSEHKDINCYIYNANTVSYPLVYMAQEASKMFKNSSTYEEVFARLEDIRLNHQMLFYVHKNDAAKTAIKNGKLYTIKDGELVLFPKEKGFTSYEQLVNIYSNINNSDEIIPFLLYSSKTNILIELVLDLLIDINPNYKKMKSYPIAPGVGIKMGNNIIGLGYIKK